MEQSENIADLATALAIAQGQIENALKTRENPHFRSKYADLAGVWDACRDALSSNGLSVIQSPGELVDGRMAMTTQLCHKSGQWVRGSLTIPLGKADAQAYGSATSYARRYALAAFVGVSPADDDGEAATAAKPKTVAKSEPVISTGRKSSAQAKKDGDDVTIKAEIGKASTADLIAWREHFDTRTAHLPQSWLDSIRDMIDLRAEEIDADEAGANMDEGFRAAVG
jgi:hypothetical protein